MLLLANGLFAQEYRYLNMGKVDQVTGLSSPNIRKIIKDKKGFIWIATQDGLNRYDGVSMLHFNSNAADPRYATFGNDFHDIVADNRNNCVWAAASNGGLTKIDIDRCAVQSHFALDTARLHTANPWYKSLFVQGDTLYVCIKDGFVLRMQSSTGRLISVTDVSALLKRSVLLDKIFVDSTKNIWLCTNTGITVLDAAANTVIASIPLANATGKSVNIFTTYNYIMYGAARLLLATSYGLKAIDLNRQQHDKAFEAIVFKNTGLDTLKIFAVQQDTGRLYFSNTNGLFILNTGSTVVYKASNFESAKNNDLFSNAYALFKDGQQLWIGNTEGLSYIKNLHSPYIALYSSSSNPAVHIDHAYHLFASNDSCVYVCASDGLYYANIVSGNIRQIDGSEAFMNVFRVGKDNYFASTINAIYTLDNDRLSPAQNRYPELNLVGDDFIIASAVYKDSLVFLASQNRKGIYQWDVVHHTVSIINQHSHPVALQNDEIANLMLDDNHTLIIVSHNLLSVYDFLRHTMQHHYLPWPGTQQPADILMDICKKNNHYFVAAYGKGIVETDSHFKVTNTVSTAQGLTSPGLYKIFAINDSILLATTNSNAFLYNRNSKRTSVLTPDKGMHSNSFEQTSGYQLPNVIFAGGIHGITSFSPASTDSSMQPPALYFTTVKTEATDTVYNQFDLTLQSVTIPSNWLQTTVSFIGLHYAYPQGVHYKYKIKELDTAWIDNENRHFINLIGLPPGDYSLQVKAANEDGYWSEPKQLRLTFLPKWYQTLLFKMFVLAVIALFFYTLYKLRLGYLKKQQLIRQSISADLHDDIGGTLNSIKMFVHVAETAENKNFYLNEIKESINQATVGLRDMIWVLNDKNDTVAEMVDRLRQFAIPVASLQNIEVNITSDGLNDMILTKTEKRNLLLIAKESINNAIKYSGCKKINIIFLQEGKKLSLIIRDDGSGFDGNTYIPGNGLRNIQERAKQIRYKATINTLKGSGTEIIITA